MTREEKDLAEYEKDLNEMKEQILKEGDALLTKRDLLERFCEIDKEYNGRPWNLLQILSNINILIGEEPCEDAINREQAIETVIEAADDWDGECNLTRAEIIEKAIKALPLVTPKPKTGYWIPSHIPESILDECSECGFSCGAFTFNYCPNCGCRMVKPQESEEE